MKEGVRYIGDILKEVAKEEGMKEMEVKDLFSVHKKYVKSLMDKEEVTLIHLPSLGSLYFSPRHFNLIESKSRDKEQYKDEKIKAKKVLGDIEEHKKRDIKTKYSYVQYKRTTLIRLIRAIKRSLKIPYKKTDNKKKNIEFLENYTLGLIKEGDTT